MSTSEGPAAAGPSARLRTAERMMMPLWLIRVLARFGHWEWEHEFKTCPSGDRHCQHYRYKLGRGPL